MAILPKRWRRENASMKVVSRAIEPLGKRERPIAKRAHPSTKVTNFANMTQRCGVRRTALSASGLTLRKTQKQTKHCFVCLLALPTVSKGGQWASGKHL